MSKTIDLYGRYVVMPGILVYMDAIIMSATSASVRE